MGRAKGTKNKFRSINGIDVLGDITHIHISHKDYGEKICIIDTEDYEIVKEYKWSIRKQSNTFYAVANGLSRCGRFRRSVFIHQIIMNTPDGMHTDHIDSYGLNNTKSNLRVCTHSENLRNKKPIPGRIKGLYVRKDLNTKKYSSRIKYNQKNIHLGYFKTVEEAATAYNEASLKYFGEFARINTEEDIKLYLENNSNPNIDLL